ncbi:MAG: putative flap endonuclease-1-like 5' DNA nuclease [Cognaticolwellia sp.]
MQGIATGHVMPLSFSYMLLLVALFAGLGAGWMLRAALWQPPQSHTQPIVKDVRLVGLELHRLQSELQKAQRIIAGFKGARPAFLSTDPNDPADDFVVIRGIGDLEQLMLHNLGVRSFAHLAMLNHKDVAYVASRMEMDPRRIDVEMWVEQAQTLAQLKGDALD